MGDLFKELNKLLELLRSKKIIVNKTKLLDINNNPNPLGYILYNYFLEKRIDKIIKILSLKPGDIVIKKTSRSEPFNHPDVKLYHEYLEKIWIPKKAFISVFMPCTSIKPYRKSITHRIMLKYIKELNSKGCITTLYSISEPMIIVPYEYEILYPLSNYDFPPKLMSDKEKLIMATKISKLLPKIARRTKQYIVAILPTHHRLIFSYALLHVPQWISDKTIIIPYGRLAFKTLKRSYEIIKALCMKS